jgi:hypothetical protein
VPSHAERLWRREWVMLQGMRPDMWTKPGRCGQGHRRTGPARVQAGAQADQIHCHCLHRQHSEAQHTSGPAAAPAPTLGQLEDVLLAVHNLDGAVGAHDADVTGVEPAIGLHHLLGACSRAHIASQVSRLLPCSLNHAHCEQGNGNLHEELARSTAQPVRMHLSAFAQSASSSRPRAALAFSSNHTG